MTRGNADTGEELVKVFLVAEGSAPHPGDKADFTLPATSETQALLGLSDRLRYSPIAPTFGEPTVRDGVREPSRVVAKLDAPLSGFRVGYYVLDKSIDEMKRIKASSEAG
jgi:hypothetical protein